MKNRTFMPIKTTLGDIAEISSGGTPSRAKPTYWNGSIPWVKTGQIKGRTINTSDIDEWITEEGLKMSATKMLPAGTILIAMYGQGKTRGRVAALGFPATINQACAAIKLKPNADREFVFQQLLSKYSLIRRLSNTGGQENLSSTLIKEIPISLPPLPEQKAIAAVLQCWDRGIQKLEAKLAAKERVKKGLMQQLLSGRRRMPGFGKGRRMTDGEWRMPEGWKAIPLGDLGSFSKGVGLSKAELTVEGLPCLRYGEIYTTTDFILNRFRSFIPKAVAAVSKRIKYNDLLFAGSGETAEEIGKCLAYLRKNEEAYAGGDIVILSVNTETAKADYLSYFLNTIGRKQLNRLGQGQSVVHLYSKDLSRVDIPLPPPRRTKSHRRSIVRRRPGDRRHASQASGLESAETIPAQPPGRRHDPPPGVCGA